LSRTYVLRIAGPAARALAYGLPEKVAAAAYELITGPLLESPHPVVRPLGGPLAPAWTARRGTYRVLYLIDEEAGVVQVTAIRHRADAYRT
jgi:mRNA interferase RelE/StbE